MMATVPGRGGVLKRRCEPASPPRPSRGAVVARCSWSRASSNRSRCGLTGLNLCVTGFCRMLPGM